jgi:hypothetical protein
MDQRTINVAFEEEVGLSLRRLRAWPFPINLVLDIAHGDECSYDASPFTGLCCSGDRPIVNVFCGRYTSAIIRLREDEADLAAIVVGMLRCTLIDGPGIRSRVAIIFIGGDERGKVWEGIYRVLAYGHCTA